MVVIWKPQPGRWAVLLNVKACTLSEIDSPKVVTFSDAILFKILVMAIIAITAGCASAPLKTEASTSGIRAAEEVGAADVPNASLHLQLAKEELAHARELAEKDEKGMADSMLLRSKADAELALLLSREDAEKTEAEAAVKRVREFRESNQ